MKYEKRKRRSFVRWSADWMHMDSDFPIRAVVGASLWMLCLGAIVTVVLWIVFVVVQFSFAELGGFWTAAILFAAAAVILCLSGLPDNLMRQLRGRWHVR